MIYEHRDEAPIREYIYRGQKYLRYRRCHGGTVQDSLPFIDEKQVVTTTEEKEEKEIDKSKHYKEMIAHLKELDEISHDISGEESKRILRNIWRWIDDKRLELKMSGEKD
jgi:predicted ATP-binding protein involved in virulence